MLRRAQWTQDSGEDNLVAQRTHAERAGQNNVPLMDQIFNGVNFAGVGVVGQGGLTAAQALRRSTTTNGFIANGNVGGFANFVNTNATLAPGANAGKPGGLLLNAGLPQNFIVVSPQFGNVQLHDNSNNSSGTFYEGAMTTGYPSDDTEEAIQADIVAAKYAVISK